MRSASLEEIDKTSLVHPFTELASHAEIGPRIIDRADRISVWDRSGREILDGASGLWCVNIGYGREEVAQAIYQQACKLPFFHSFASMANEPSIRLAERILEVAPERMKRVLFGNSGSDANDTEIKLAWYYNNLRGKPRKKKIISRLRAYHGVTVASGSLTGLPQVHADFDLPIPQVIHTRPTYFYRDATPPMTEPEYATWLAAQLDALIEAQGPDTVAAFIAEPVMGTGGVLTPPQGYFAQVQKILRKHDVLLIADEVITGFGRLGSMFGATMYEMRPDMMTLAKGLTSGYQPMSATLLSNEIWEALVSGSRVHQNFGHGYTYSAHPVAAAAGLANLDILEREDLVGNAARTGAYFQAQLRSALREEPLVGDVRGEGLMAGVELVADRATRRPFDPSNKVHVRVAKQCYEHEALIVRPLPDGHVLGFSPPLVISRVEVDDLIARFVRGLRAVTDAMSREG